MRARRLQLRGFLVVLPLGAAVPAVAQDAPQETPAVALPSETPIADAADRIARERWAAGIPDQVQSEGSTFRLNIQGQEVEIRAPWLQEPDPVNRRPVGGSLYHQQMLEHIVPREFRASTFNSAGVGVDPATIVNGIRGVWRDWRVRRIRAQIARELAELEAANAAADR